MCGQLAEDSHVSRNRFRAAWWSVVIVVAFGASACANSSSQPEPLPAPSPTIAPPSSNALATVSAAAARTLGLSASMSLDFAGLSFTDIRGEGSFDFASGTGLAHIRQPVGTETVVFRPSAIYDHPPPQNAVGLPRGRTWIMAEPAEHIANATSFAQFVLQIQGKNPIFLLAQVAWGAVTAAPLGKRMIDGVSASGFLVEVDLASAASAASGPVASAFASTLGYEEQALGASAQSPAPLQRMRAWVDSSGRIVQIQASPPGSGVGTTTMTVTSFGADVDAAKPPMSRTVDLASLAPGGDYDRD